MPDYQEQLKNLQAMASVLPGRHGFHNGMRDNQNAVELEYGQMLYGAIQDRRPTHVVELGTAAGYSASWILLGLEKNESGHLWTVDVSIPQPPVWEQIGLPTERLTFMNEMVQDAIEQLPKTIDILFHDASHDFNDIKKDFEALQSRIPKGGIFMVHDVNFRREMGDLVAKMFDEMPDVWNYQEISMGCGMGIAKRLT